MPATRDDLARLVVSSRLLSAEELKQFWDRLPRVQRPKTPQEFAEVLVLDKLLTPFQAEALLSGSSVPLVIGDYVLLELRGEGGMGQVYKARHRRMDRIVALKVLPGGFGRNSDAVKRFEREVKAAGRLIHTNIVQSYDAGEWKNTHYLVMEYIEGNDLADLVRKFGRFRLEQAAGCLLQAARGLAYAHSQGVIHRDIKPGNLIFDSQGVLKILDMGLARLESEVTDGLTKSNHWMGTLDFMAPEQAESSKSVDARADIYSLGATLWFLLTGRPMYGGDSIEKKIMAHRNNPIPNLTAVRPEIPSQFDRLFCELVAKLPEDRVQTMLEVEHRLKAFAPAGSEKIAVQVSNDDSQSTRFFDGVAPNRPHDGVSSAGEDTLRDQAEHLAGRETARGYEVQRNSPAGDPMPQPAFAQVVGELGKLSYIRKLQTTPWPLLVVALMLFPADVVILYSFIDATIASPDVTSFLTGCVFSQIGLIGVWWIMNVEDPLFSLLTAVGVFAGIDLICVLAQWCLFDWSTGAWSEILKVQVYLAMLTPLQLILPGLLAGTRNWVILAIHQRDTPTPRGTPAAGYMLLRVVIFAVLMLTPAVNVLAHASVFAFLLLWRHTRLYGPPLAFVFAAMAVALNFWLGDQFTGTATFLAGAFCTTAFALAWCRVAGLELRTISDMRDAGNSPRPRPARGTAEPRR